MNDKDDVQEFKDIIHKYEEELAKIYSVPTHLLTEVRDPKNDEN